MKLRATRSRTCARFSATVVKMDAAKCALRFIDVNGGKLCHPGACSVIFTCLYAALDVLREGCPHDVSQSSSSVSEETLGITK